MGVEDRFWHLTEGTDSSLLSSEDDESLVSAPRQCLIVSRPKLHSSWVMTAHPWAGSPLRWWM